MIARALMALTVWAAPLQGFWSEKPNITTADVFKEMANDLKGCPTTQARKNLLEKIGADIENKNRFYAYSAVHKEVQEQLPFLEDCVAFLQERPFYQDKIEESSVFYSQLRPHEIPWFKDLSFKAKDYNDKKTPSLADAYKILACDSCKKVLELEKTDPEKFKKLNTASLYLLLPIRTKEVPDFPHGTKHVPLEEHVQVPAELRRQAAAFLICGVAQSVVNKEATPASKYIK